MKNMFINHTVGIIEALTHHNLKVCRSKQKNLDSEISKNCGGICTASADVSVSGYIYARVLQFWSVN